MFLDQKMKALWLFFFYDSEIKDRRYNVIGLFSYLNSKGFALSDIVQGEKIITVSRYIYIFLLFNVIMGL